MNDLRATTTPSDPNPSSPHPSSTADPGAPTPPAAPARPSRRRLVVPALVAGLAAAATTTAIAAVAGGLGVSFEVPAGGEAIPLLGFAQITFLATLIGLGIAAVLRRRPHAARTFVVVTVGLTAVSCIPSVLLDAEPMTKVVLVLTHLAAAAIVIPVVARALAD